MTDLPALTDIEAAGARRLSVPAADWITLAGGSAWTALATRKVQRLDGASGSALSATAIPNQSCLAMDAGFGSVWVGSCGMPSVLNRVDVAAGRESARIELPGMLEQEGSVAAGEEAVWALTARPNKQLVKVDPATNAVVDRFGVPNGAVAVRAGLGALWVTDNEAGEVLRLDPTSGETVTAIKVGLEPRFLAVGPGAVWVMNQAAGSVSLVDPVANAVVATVVVGDGAVRGGDIAVGGGFVWVRASDSLVVKVDPGTNRVVTRYGPVAGSGSVAADDDALWVSAHDIDVVWRLGLR